MKGAVITVSTLVAVILGGFIYWKFFGKMLIVLRRSLNLLNYPKIYNFNGPFVIL